jgi:MFS transporter, CP family, cyanate transporter
VDAGQRGPAVAAATGGTALAVAIVLSAVNLRPAITSVGPLLDEARDSLGTSATWAGILTTIPVLCFAGAGLAAPALARRIGVVAAIGLALGLIGVGVTVRVLDGPVVVIGGTLVAAAGIAVVGVLIPAVIKASFPGRIGLLTGVYTAALQFGAMVGFAVTPVLAAWLGGWRPAWASWSVLVGMALLAWPVAVRQFHSPAPATRFATPPTRSLLRIPRAWIVTVFFGLQAFVAFVVMSWLPQVLMDSGVSRGDAGLMLGLLAALAIPISLLVAPLATRRASQSGWITSLGGCAVAGTAGLLINPGAAPLLWTILLGLGLSVFSLALAVIALRARNSHDTASLSGMAQGFGYLIAGTGPFLFGLLHDVTDGWTVPFGMLMGVLALQLVAGVLAGRAGHV